VRHPPSKLADMQPDHADVRSSAPDPIPGLPRFAVVDIETSGLSVRRHRILQVAVVVVQDGVVVDEWSSLAKLRWPLQRVGPRKVHGISRKMLRRAPPLHQVLTDLFERLDGAVFTAHNVGFDWAFIERAARQAGVAGTTPQRLCTLHLSRRLDPERQRSHRLADVCARYGVANEHPHNAIYDARATAAVLPYLLHAHGVRASSDLDPLYERR
jgi:DNA polymerase-3 subunit epsilon